MSSSLPVAVGVVDSQVVALVVIALSTSLELLPERITHEQSVLVEQKEPQVALAVLMATIQFLLLSHQLVEAVVVLTMVWLVPTAVLVVVVVGQPVVPKLQVKHLHRVRETMVASRKMTEAVLEQVLAVVALVRSVVTERK
jgi:hypothetical protein